MRAIILILICFVLCFAVYYAHISLNVSAREQITNATITKKLDFYFPDPFHTGYGPDHNMHYQIMVEDDNHFTAMYEVSEQTYNTFHVGEYITNVNEAFR